MKVRISLTTGSHWDVNVPDNDPAPLPNMWAAISQHEVLDATIVRNDASIRSPKRVLFNPVHVATIMEA